MHWPARLRSRGALCSRVLAGFAFVISGGCGENGLLPGTIDPGADYEIAEVIFDEDFFYCRVEPMLFERRCGPGDPAKGDSGGGCHAQVTSYRLSDYSPLMAASCNGVVRGASVAPSARQNYQTSQARMKRDPEAAPLLTRPTGVALHPRVIFASESAEADLIRQWATRFSTQ